MCALHQEKIQEIEKSLVKIDADVTHIKERIDNGMSVTITKMWERMNEDIMPVIQDSKFWIGKIKWGFFWITTIAIGGGLAKILIDWVN